MAVIVAVFIRDKPQNFNIPIRRKGDDNLRKKIKLNDRVYDDSFVIAYAEQLACQDKISKERALDRIISEWLPLISQFALGITDGITNYPCMLTERKRNLFMQTEEEKKENPLPDKKKEKEKEEKKVFIQESISENDRTEPVPVSEVMADLQTIPPELKLLVQNEKAMGKSPEETARKLQGSFPFDISEYVRKVFEEDSHKQSSLTEEETSMFLV